MIFTDPRAQDLFGDFPDSDLKKFLEFNKLNPHIREQFDLWTLKRIAEGRKRYGARKIYEEMRWDTRATQKGQVFKMNDRFIGIIARLFIYNHQQYEGFFEFRVIRSKGIPSEEERRRAEDGSYVH
jgi:hypothetical protein